MLVGIFISRRYPKQTVTTTWQCPMNSSINSSKIRLDIQGLRAIAVTLVVLDHALGFPTGGFVGVDVFFVISGYLITAHILREIESTGSLSILGFYSRRVRRILPVALVVLIMTVMTAYILWLPPRASQALVDSFSALAFVANFHFMALGTDYLQQDAVASPFQHYWSLSIEEQFYAVWPLTLFAIAIFIKSKRSMIATVSTVFVISLAWGSYRSVTMPSMAYFDTGARVWELLAGALLAMGGTSVNELKMTLRARKYVSFLGVLIILTSAFMITPTWVTPVPAVVPAVIGTIIVIWSNASIGPRTLLGNPIAQWLGKVSYSLYLWHFPVLIFASAEFGHSWIVGLSVMPIMLMLSWFSYAFVEKAVLDSSFLKGKQANTRQAKRLFPDLALGVSILGAITIFSIVQLYGHSAVRSAQPWMKIFDRSEVTDFEIVSDQEHKVADIIDALEATAWPENILDQLASLSQSDFADAMFLCRDAPTTKNPRRVCQYEHGDIPVAVIGDSVAASWAPAIEKIAIERGWNVTVVSYSNCSLFDVDVTNGAADPDFMHACKQRRDEMFRFLKDLNPNIVFLSSSESALSYTGLEIDSAAAEWEAGSERTFHQLEAVNQVIVLENPPWGANPSECATRYSSPRSCVERVSDRHMVKSVAEASAAEKFDNVAYMPTRSWFCFEGLCPAFSSGLVTRVDRAHLTSAAAMSLSQLIAVDIQADN